MEEKQKPQQNQRPGQQEKRDERLVRILAKDIEGRMKIYVGLTKIKGVSWSVSNATCKMLNLDKEKKIGSLTEKEIEQISEFIRNPKTPSFLKNQKSNFETGKDSHLTGSDLELKTEFDIKRLKKIKAYRGLRHLAGLPTKGQRTRSHFRKNRRKGSGIKKKEGETKK